MNKKNYQQYLSDVRKEYPNWTVPEWKEEALKRLNNANNEPETIEQPEVKNETIISSETKKEEVGEIKKGKEDEMIMFSKSDILSLINTKGSDSETKELLKQIITTAKASNIPESLRNRVTSIKENEIDQDDYMPDEKTFFSYRAYYALYGDKKYGREIETPYGTPIRFTFFSAKHMHDDSKFAQSTLCLCVARIHSKKEYEWLKSCSQYGKEFHEEIAGVHNIDVTLANKYGEVNSMISSWSQHQVLKRAEIEGITITTDIEDVKNRLIQLLANQEIGRIKEQRERSAKTYHSSERVEVNPEEFLNKKKVFA